MKMNIRQISNEYWEISYDHIMKLERLDKDDLFISAIVVIDDQFTSFDALPFVCQKISESFNDYEILILINGAPASYVEVVRNYLQEFGLMNVIVSVLAVAVDREDAFVTALDQAIGDYVIQSEPEYWQRNVDILLKQVRLGVDATFIISTQSRSVQLLNDVYTYLYWKLSGFRLHTGPVVGSTLTRRMANMLLSRSDPLLALRHLPAAMSGSYIYQDLNEKQVFTRKLRLLVLRIKRGFRLLLRTSGAPLRLVTFVSALGASLSLLYAIYALLSHSVGSNMEPGWLSLTLQQSSMFFFLSISILILSEYFLQNNVRGQEKVFILQEFHTEVKSKGNRLNVEHR